MAEIIFPRRNSKLFWITFVIFLGLAVTPAIIMFDQIKAEVGYWFSTNSMSSESEEMSETETLIDGEKAPVMAKIDSDQDGLPDYLETSFFQTDPKNADTDGDSFSDKQELENGYDPRSTYKAMVDTDRDWIKDEWERDRYGTNPAQPDTDNDGVNDGLEIMSGSNPLDNSIVRINPDLESYTMTMDKIGTAAPLVFVSSREEEDIYEGLKSGYVHYDKTAFPGEDGDAVFFCHSSGRFGSRGNFDTLCANLDQVERGDEIVISGGSIKLRYRITSRKNDYDPADPNIFRKTNRPTLSLISCYPVGTNHQRIVVRAELVSL